MICAVSKIVGVVSGCLAGSISNHIEASLLSPLRSSLVEFGSPELRTVIC